MKMFIDSSSMVPIAKDNLIQISDYKTYHCLLHWSFISLRDNGVIVGNRTFHIFTPQWSTSEKNNTFVHFEKVIELMVLGILQTS